MSKLSPLLKVYRTEHPILGATIELYSTRAEDGRAAYFIEENQSKEDVGIGIRFTKRTALKLADALKKLAEEMK